jgi:DNA polymerase-1
VLVQLKEDCDAAGALDDFKLTAIPPDPLGRVPDRTRLQFSLLKRLGEGRGSPERKVQLNPAKPVNAGAAVVPGGSRQAAARTAADRPIAMPASRLEEALAGWIERAFAARLVAFDTETSALDAMRRICRDQPGAGAPTGLLYPAGPWRDRYVRRKAAADRRCRALALLKPLLESDAVLKVGQNAKYDLNVLARHGITVSPIDDTMVMSFALMRGAAGRRHGGGHGMDELADAPPWPHHASPSRMSAAPARRRSLCRSAARPRHRICRRRCRCHLAAAPPAQAPPGRRRRHPHL